MRMCHFPLLALSLERLHNRSIENEFVYETCLKVGVVDCADQWPYAVIVIR
jgi:hypothetical protein